MHRYKHLSDFELVDLITRENHKQAFAELMARHNQLITSTVLNMVEDKEDTKEVIQQVFVRFYKSIANFKKQSAVGTYLTRIAINQSLNLLKRRQKYTTRTTSLELAGDVTILATASGFEQREIVHLALMRLNAANRAVVTLRMIDGYSTDETAKILNLPKGTVMSRLKRSMDKLKVILKDDLNYEL